MTARGLHCGNVSTEVLKSWGMVEWGLGVFKRRCCQSM